MYKKILCFFLIIFSLISLFSCSDGWQGYENEDLDKYISYGEMAQIDYITVEISDSYVDKEISEMLDGISTYEITTEPFNETSKAILSCICVVNDEIDDSLSFTDFEYSKDETDETINLICDNLIGKCAGDSYTSLVSLPVGFMSLEKQTEAIYTVSVLSVKKKITAELNDENAKKLDTTANTVGELKENVKAKLKAEKEKEVNYQAAYQEWMKYYEESSLISIPYEPYMEYYKLLSAPYELLADSLGVTFEEYVTQTLNRTVEEFESSLSQKALEKLQNTILIRVTAKKIGITYTEDDIKGYCDTIAESSDGEFVSGDEYLEYFGEDNVTNDYLFDKIIEYYTVK